MTRYAMMFSSEQVLETHGIANATGVFCCPKQLHTCSAQGAPFIDHAAWATPVLASWVSSLDERRTLRVQGANMKKKHGPGYLYLIHAVGTDLYKIGLATNVARRFLAISYAVPFDIDLLHIIPTDRQLDGEQFLHQVFAEKRVRGEWFRLTQRDVAAIRLCTGPTCDQLLMQFVTEYYYHGVLPACSIDSLEHMSE